MQRNAKICILKIQRCEEKIFSYPSPHLWNSSHSELNISQKLVQELKANYRSPFPWLLLGSSKEASHKLILRRLHHMNSFLSQHLVNLMVQNSRPSCISRQISNPMRSRRQPRFKLQLVSVTNHFQNPFITSNGLPGRQTTRNATSNRRGCYVQSISY